MRVRLFVLAAVAALATVTPARADLVLEFVEVASLTAPLSSAPALTSLTMNPSDVRFIQVVLRDTVGPGNGAPGTPLPAGPSGTQGQPTWSTNGNDATIAGPGSVGLGAFFIQLNSIAGVAENLANPGNSRLVDPISFGTLSSGTSPPTFTRIGGALNFESEPGPTPDPTSSRIGLANFRIVAQGPGNGNLTIQDPNPAPTNQTTAVLRNSDFGGSPFAGDVVGIDDLLFGVGGTTIYALPVTVTPEPSSFVLGGLALAGLGYRKLRRRKVVAA
jgi:hypothetical protein